MTTCPPREQLACLLAEQLSAPEADRVEAHVQACARCQDALGRLSTGSPTDPGTPAPRARPTPPDEPRPDFLRRLRQANPDAADTPRQGDDAAPPEEGWPAVAGYDILGELGRGGMGVVYQARHRRLGRVVALKVLLAGAHAGEQDLARFQAEAEAVARLQHPNLVQVYEVGEERGCPYLALEYVDGGTLADRLRGTPLPAREAARLAETLARAVHVAHERGVVHRDLKPANVLLTADGTPKITDFGLARRLDGATLHTQTGAVLGTPDYMAPEQVEGKAVGPAADVHALGALLYQMLTGRPPFLADNPLDTLLRVRLEEPVPPRLLQPRVPRDLETVCLKCLRKEPHRRYATAADLADDLRRFRDGKPVRARPTSLPERGLKWVKRRPALAAALAAAALILVTGLVLLELENRQTREQRDLAEKNYARAAEQERKAKGEAAKAAAVTRFLTNDLLFQAAPQNNARDKHVTVEEVLDRSAAKVGTALAETPEAEAEVRQAIGRTYLELGLYPKAEAQARRAVDLYAVYAGPDAPDTLIALNLLALTLDKQARFGEAEPLYRRAWEARRRVSGPEHRETLIVLSNLAVNLDRQRRQPEAEELCRQALEARRRVLGPADPATLISLVNLGQMLLVQDRPREAEPLLREALEALVRTQPESPAALLARGNLAWAQRELGKLAEAEPLYRRAYDDSRRVLGPTHPDTLSALNGLALVLKYQGRYDEAEPLYRQCIAETLALRGPTHPQTLAAQLNLAGLLVARGKPAEAERLARAVLDVRLRTPGPEAPETLLTMTRLGEAILAQKEPGRAEPLLREALRLHRKVLPGHAQTAGTLVLLGRALVEDGKPDEAEPLLREAVTIRRKVLPPGDWTTASADSTLGDCLRARGRYAEAEPLLRESQKVLAQARGAPPPIRRDAVDRLVRLYEDWHKPEQAAAWRERRAKRGDEKE